MTELELYLKDYLDKHIIEIKSPTYLRIYDDLKNGDEINDMLCNIFANIHENLNICFDELNRRGPGGHFLADDSRYIISVSSFLDDLTFMTQDTSYKFTIDPYYNDILQSILKFATRAYGCDIPNDFQRIKTINYKPIFSITYSSFVKTNKKTFKKIYVGSGSYANVHKYFDDDYNQYFAIKKLKKDVTEKEIQRFKKEYETMKKCEHPNLLRVYKFFDTDKSYTMEYCSDSLFQYINKNNNKLEKITRISLLNQFLNGIGYIHSIGLLHRDLSYGNILIKTDAYGNPFLKLSDFGLVKDNTEAVTASDSSVKGTFRDPCLSSFKDYNFKNEVYAMAFVIIFILYGRQSPKKDDCIYPVIKKCLSPNTEERYSSLKELRSDISSHLNNY